jgi:mannose-6-phosphate isomerase-like protein (cupin superfamily)
MHTDMTQAWIILEGTGEAILGNGRRDVVGPGTMIVHHPTQMHGIVNIGETNLVYINVSERPPAV